MDKDDNIYLETPPTEKADKVTEIAPPRVRARFIRNSVLTFLLMICLLAGAVYLAYINDQKGERPEFRDVKLEDMVAPKRVPTNQLSHASIVFPDVPASFEDLAQESSRFPTAPRDPEVLAAATEAVRLANNYVKAKEWELAELYIRRALDVWPAMNVAQRMLGVIYTQKGQFDQAITMLSQALTTDPFSAETYSNLATAYMHKGQLDKAENYLNTALKMRPDFIVANLNLGLLYLATGRYDWAAEYLELAVERLPNHVDVRNNLAVALLRIGRYEDARMHLQALIDSDADMAHAYFNVAITYTLEGDFEEAMRWIESGSSHCSPIAFQQFVSDQDFQELHVLPEFQSLLRGIYGELPELNGS